MKQVIWVLATLGVIGLGSLGTAEERSMVFSGERVTLQLSGKYCDSYPEDIERALKDVAGVKAVDLKSKPGHALVDIEPGKARAEQLAAVVDTVKGYGWHCKAQVMK